MHAKDSKHNRELALAVMPAAAVLAAVLHCASLYATVLCIHLGAIQLL
jgi:hypothetical protein